MATLPKGFRGKSEEKIGATLQLSHFDKQETHKKFRLTSTPGTQQPENTAKKSR